MAKLIKRGKNWYSYFKAGGKRIKRSLGPDHSQAKIALNKLVEQYQLKKISTGFNPSWAGFQARYLTFRQSSPLKQNTIYWDKLAFKHFDSFFKIKWVDDVHKEMIQAFQHKLHGLGTMAPSSINRLVRSLKQSIRKGMEWGCISGRDIAVKRMREPEGRLIWYTPEQCEKILSECSGRWRTMALLGIRAGLRRSEIAWLTWDDIDLDRKVIRITGKAGWSPKGGKSRYVPMFEDLAEHLSKLPNKEGFLFAHDDKSIDVMTSYFKKIIKKAECKGSMHAFRHTFGSHLFQAGEYPRVVKELMGHSDIKTTMIYAHLAPENLKSAIDKLPKFGPLVGVTH